MPCKCPAPPGRSSCCWLQLAGRVDDTLAKRSRVGELVGQPPAPPVPPAASRRRKRNLLLLCGGLQVRKISVKQVVSPIIFDNLKTAVRGGLYDPDYGPMDPKER